jgi:hypothetical protein
MSVEEDTVFIHDVTEGADELWAWVPRIKTKKKCPYRLPRFPLT